ncbi:translationally controlled tumor protein [Kickxella alabastrina]|uniref:translationally controlled tumor protein n=1 Tax=Kickxella alabastrina TaxID=61397 RepID=UPI00221FC89F|nr:translationally controlled tumor protein [Kickxella alabastrina]KAI7834765.1 translationally controlled tumor protein [Kickxella alabastrina]KAJ1947467.1 hypothetical protein GGF37_000407 [Kickxella alabastrina]
MFLFNDILTGDELFSDGFDVTLKDGIYEVDCKMITVGGDNDIDIGANASAEEPAEDALDSTSETVNNVVYSFRLVPSSFDKKSYMTYIKGYMKSLEKLMKEDEAKTDDDITAFKANAAKFVKKVLGDIKNYEFYTGESMNPEGMVALLNYREDGVTPYFSFFADGVKPQKL